MAPQNAVGKYIFLSLRLCKSILIVWATFQHLMLMRLSGAEMTGCQIIHIMRHFKNLRPVVQMTNFRKGGGRRWHISDLRLSLDQYRAPSCNSMSASS